MAYSLQYGSATLTGTVAGEEEPGIRWGAQTLDRGANPRQLPIGEGLHRVTLDITYPGSRRVPGAQGRGITAPIAPPGMYTVRLTVDGEVREQPLEIRADPRLATTAEDYAAQFAFMIRLRDKVSEIHDTVNALRDLRGQIEGRLRPLDDRAEWTPVREAAERVLVQLTEIEEVLIQPGLHERSGELDSVHFPIRLNNKLEALGYHVARSDDAPTAQAEELYADLAGRADAQLARFRRVVNEDVAAFNRAMVDAAVPAVVVPRTPSHGKGRSMTIIHKVSSDWDARIWFEGTGWAERRLELTPEIAGWEFLSFRTYTFRAGQVIDGESAGDEMAMVLLSGAITMEVAGPGWSDTWEMRGRSDVFDGPPFALYLPPGHTYKLTVHADADCAYGRAPATGARQPRLIRPEETGRRALRPPPARRSPRSSVRTWRRICPARRWSSRQAGGAFAEPGEHGARNEVTYFRMKPESGWAVQRLIGPDGLDETFAVRHGDAVAVRGGEHPVVAGPGTDVYVLRFAVG